MLSSLSNKALGDAYELAAAEYLQAQGLTLLDQQARYKLGELDLVMQDKTCLVFVEVRFRKYQTYGGATWSITRSKQRKLRNAAFLWMKIHGYSCSHSEGKQTFHYRNF